jgi:hypothetical protein
MRRILLALFLGLAACAGSTSASAPLPRGAVALRARDLDGNAVLLGSLRGRVVIVTVIATWADTALFEVPRLKALYERYSREELAIVCLALDDMRAAIEVFVDSFSVPYPVLVPEDPEGLVGPEGPFGAIAVIPTSVVLAPSGEIAIRSDGVWPEGVLEKAIDRLLAGDRRNR